MKILITGAGGFIGPALASALLSSTPGLSELILTDVFEPPIPPESDASNAKVTRMAADLTSSSTIAKLFTPDIYIIYLMHGLMSFATEANLDLGLKINVDSMRLILDHIRTTFTAKQPAVKIIFPSSLAVYGIPPGHFHQVISENVRERPGTSYGSQKLITETLLVDFSRKGFVDARVVRLPTVIVRPGKPSGAASSFCSGIFREPLKGWESVLPVNRSTELWVCSTRKVVENLVWAKDVPSQRFEGGGLRVVNLPGITVSVQDMLDALVEVGGEKARSLVVERRDEGIERIFQVWPARFDIAWARELGFKENGGLVETVKEYLEDYCGK
ncbi:MAG: hypothetical protein MMC33_001562 [Icmadophila ericetorum]|nr:hypothetical protein [Icmadophila ericetorum]